MDYEFFDAVDLTEEETDRGQDYVFQMEGSVDEAYLEL